LSTKTVLNLGCGKKNKVEVDKAFVGEDWTEIMVDADSGMQPDVVADARDLSPIEDESADGVFSSHMLEHIPGCELEKALLEILRVLTPGSWFYAVVPDLAIAAQEVLADRHEETFYDSISGPIRPIDMIYGWGKHADNDLPLYAHRNGFTSRSLAHHLSTMGFDPVFTRRSAGQVFAKARKPEEVEPLK
jgi:SAM-dependent methyltransferase